MKTSLYTTDMKAWRSIYIKHSNIPLQLTQFEIRLDRKINKIGWIHFKKKGQIISKNQKWLLTVIFWSEQLKSTYRSKKLIDCEHFSSRTKGGRKSSLLPVLTSESDIPCTAEKETVQRSDNCDNTHFKRWTCFLFGSLSTYSALSLQRGYFSLFQAALPDFLTLLTPKTIFLYSQAIIFLHIG